MSVNRYHPHVLILPEDDADSQLANGFLLHHSLRTRNVQVLEPAGGWMHVVHCFESDHVVAMDRFPERRMVLLVDFDGDTNRLNLVKGAIPERLIDRVFVIGALTEPENLKPDLGDYETIGVAMARDCHEGTTLIWGHDLLRHNGVELERLRRDVFSILF